MDYILQFLKTVKTDYKLIKGALKGDFNIEDKTKTELIENIENLKEYFKNNNIIRINLTDYIKQNQINSILEKIVSSFTEEETLYKSLSKKIESQDKLTLEEICVLGFKLCNIGSITSKIIQNDYKFYTLKLIFSYLDSMFYYTDNSGKELDYIFINFIHKFSNTPITLKDIEFILTTVILIILIDLDPKYNDVFVKGESRNISEIYKDIKLKSKKNLKLKSINNPLNFLIYINNPRISLPDSEVFSLLSKVTKYVNKSSVKDILNYPYMDYSDKILYNPFGENTTEYYTSFGHYLGHLLKFSIDDLPALKKNAMLVKLANNLISANMNFNKYTDSYKALLGQTGGGKLNVKGLLKGILTKSYNTFVKYPTLKYTEFQLKKYNKYTYNSFINRHYKTHQLKYSNSILYMYHKVDDKYPILSRLLINMSYNIKSSDLQYKNDYGINPNPNSKYLQLYIDNKKILDSVMKNIITSIQNQFNIINIISLLKFMPVIINLYDIESGSIKTDEKNTISKNFLLVLKSLGKEESKLLKTILYCFVIISNLFKCILEYFYNNDLEINESDKTLINDLLSKISSAIIKNPIKFNEDLLEFILSTKLSSVNNIYKSNKKHFNLSQEESKLLISVYDDILKNKINDIQYMDIFTELQDLQKTQKGGDNSTSNSLSAQSQSNSNNESNSSNTQPQPGMLAKVYMFMATLISSFSLPSMDDYDYLCEMMGVEDEGEKDPRDKLKTVIVNNNVPAIPLDINTRIKEGKIGKLNKANKKFKALTDKLDSVNKRKFKKFIENKKEVILKNHLMIFVLTLLEWQFCISHALLEEKVQYSIHPDYNYFISDLSYNLLDLVNDYKNNVIQNLKINSIMNKHITFLEL